METSLRIVLLLVGMVIVAGIIWDAFLSGKRRSWRGSQKNKTSFNDEKMVDRNALNRKNPFAETWEDTGNFNDEEDFEDVILVRKKATEVKRPGNSRMKQEKADTRSYQGLNERAKRSHHDSMDFMEDHTLMENESAIEDIEVSPWQPEEPAEDSRTNSEIHSIKRESKTETSQALPQTLMVLNIMARQPGVFLGRKLLEAFHEAHLIFGEMNIFHRHENTDGSGRIMFSVAAAVEPGTFNLSKVDTFVVPGITLFFNMERPNQAIAAFELMLRTAKQLVMRLDGELKDEQHKFVTLGTIEKYRDRARQFGVKKAKAV